jgi:hypothetical protein
VKVAPSACAESPPPGVVSECPAGVTPTFIKTIHINIRFASIAQTVKLLHAGVHLYKTVEHYTKYQHSFLEKLRDIFSLQVLFFVGRND